MFIEKIRKNWSLYNSCKILTNSNIYKAIGLTSIYKWSLLPMHKYIRRMVHYQQVIVTTLQQVFVQASFVFLLKYNRPATSISDKTYETLPASVQAVIALSGLGCAEEKMKTRKCRKALEKMSKIHFSLVGVVHRTKFSVIVYPSPTCSRRPPLT